MPLSPPSGSMSRATRVVSSRSVASSSAAQNSSPPLVSTARVSSLSPPSCIQTVASDPSRTSNSLPSISIPNSSATQPTRSNADHFSTSLPTSLPLAVVSSSVPSTLSLVSHVASSSPASTSASSFSAYNDSSLVVTSSPLISNVDGHNALVSYVVPSTRAPERCASDIRSLLCLSAAALQNFKKVSN